MIPKIKLVQLILIIVISLYLLIFTTINLIKTEYDDPPYNYLSRNWLNSPIKQIQLLNNPPNTNIKEYDNQNTLGFFKSDSTEQDLNIFLNNYFKIITYTPYYYPNFVGFYHKKEVNKICGKDSQGNDLYFPKDEECPINFILITDNTSEYQNSDYKIESLNINNLFLVTSNKRTEGEIITQLRINSNNKICADSSVDITFNDLLDDYKNKECKKEYGYDKIYHKIGEENIYDFLKNNNLGNMKIKKNENIFLSYRGYLAVDDIEKYEEHPVDHVTYARRIAISKNICLFVSCFFYIFCSIFFYLYIDNKKYLCAIKIIFIIYCAFFIFNFSYDFHVIFTFLRVRGIVSTVYLEGLKKYREGLRWFIVIDIFILFGIIFDLVLKILQVFLFKNKDNEENKNDKLNIVQSNDNNNL